MTTTLTTTTTHWIDGGHWAAEDPQSGQYLEIQDPALGQTIAHALIADSAAVDAAVASAKRAFAHWSEVTPTRRAQILFKFRNLLQDNADELAELVTAEHGKTLDDARGELNRALDSVEMACGVPSLLKGEVSEQSGPNIDTQMLLQPLGVCVGITPFNFPLLVPIAMFAVAIAAGNTFVLKPSEQAPTSSVRLAALMQEAGLPDGVLNVVHGGSDTATALMDHPDTVAVAFVGSTPVARKVYERAAVNGMRVQSLGGAKNHLVVMPDANLEKTADAIASAAFGAAGQRCMAVSVVVTVGDCADELVGLVKERAQQVRMGAGTTPGVEVGPVVSGQAMNRIQGIVERAGEKGARIVVDRSREKVDGFDEGFFVGPAVIDHVDTTSELYRTEVFGPVLAVVRVQTLDDAIALIRAHEYGNGAAIFTSSGRAARQFQREASAGMVGVNVPIPVPVATYAVAGWKNSVFGDTGLNNGSWRFYTQPKYLTARWDETVGGVDYGFRPN
jgi:malonate-semialdehyde dehydrogenase (acetylating) / methylmalonate-semialdehyde dehydrogenase